MRSRWLHLTPRGADLSPDSLLKRPVAWHERERRVPLGASVARDVAFTPLLITECKQWNTSTLFGEWPHFRWSRDVILCHFSEVVSQRCTKQGRNALRLKKSFYQLLDLSPLTRPADSQLSEEQIKLFWGGQELRGCVRQDFGHWCRHLWFNSVVSASRLGEHCPSFMTSLQGQTPTITQCFDACLWVPLW